MKPVITIYIIIQLLLITACESDVSVKVPDFRQKLVITAFISPSDTISYIKVFSNRKIYGEIDRDESPGNLSGIISDGSQEVMLDPYKWGLILDHKKMKIDYGKTYTLKVTSDLGMTAEATCTVPPKRTFEIEADTFSMIYPFEIRKSLGLRISFNDIQSEENYYRVAALTRAFSNSPYYEFYRSYHEIPVEDRFISDKNLDGSKFVRTGTSGFNLNEFDSVFLSVRLYHTEKSYYQYHKSIENYNRDDNPFSEATHIFTNVKDGLGIFTSYTVDSVVIRLK